MNQTNKHIQRRRSYTKWLLAFFITMALILTCICLRMANDPNVEMDRLNSVVRLTEVWYGGLAVVVAFYMWKAKNENRHKYSQQWLSDIGEKYGWEAAARFAEIDLKGD